MIDYIWLILKRDAKLFIRQNSILIGSILFPILMLLFIGFGFENIINLEDLGVSYIEFLASGIIVLFSASAAISVGYNIFYDKESKFIKEILVSPVPRIAIVLGNATLGVAWSLILFLMLGIALPLITGNFSKKLERVKGNLVESFFGEEVFEREEGKVPCAEIDREVMFGNAPKKNDDSIIAERGGW